MIDEVAELRLLAALADNPDWIFKVSEQLFFGDRIAVFKAIRESYTTYGEVSTEGVERFLGRSLPAGFEAARGQKPEPLIDKLKILSKKRQLSEISNRLNVLLMQNDPNIEEIYQTLSFQPLSVEDDSSLRPGVVEFFSDLRRKKNGQYRFIRTGLRLLDHMLGGEWGRKALTIILGQGGGGKTALIGNSMLNMARQGQPVLCFSLEMPRDRLISRMVAALTEIDNRDLKNGSVSESQVPSIEEAVHCIENLPIYILDRPGMTVSEIVSQVRIHKELYGIEAFFVDYLQIVGATSDDEVMSLGYIAQQIRNAAVRYDVAAIVLSQQNRGYDGLASIFGSGRVGHIADVVFELRTDGDEKNNEDQRIVTIDFHKNRDGPLGSQAIRYEPKYLRFEG